MQQNYRGIYDPTQSYAQYDVVSYTLNSVTNYYLCLTANDSTSPQSPTSGGDNTYWGIINTLSNFPNQVDSFLTHTVISASDKTDIQTYQDLLLTSNPTPEQQDQLNALTEKLRDKLILADDWNTLQSSISNLQQFFKDSVDGYIDQKQAEMQAEIDKFDDKGVYSSTTTYQKNNFVTYNKQTYICLKDGTVNITPSDDGVNWRLVAAQGQQGNRGLPGANLVFKGAYDTTVTYNPDDAVQYNGSVYYCTQTVVGETPQNNGTSWELFLARGSIIVSDTEPTSPTDKMVWVDSANNVFKYYNGTTSTWIEVGKSSFSASEITTSDGSDVQTELDSTNQTLNEHLADDAIDAHNATNISLIDTDDHFVATNVEGALSELFTNVSSGKQEVATAITDKGGTVADADVDGVPTFQELTDGINTLGKYKSGDILPLVKAGFPNGFRIGYGGSTGYDIRGGAPMHRSDKVFVATTNTNNYFVIYNIDRNSYSVSNQVISSNVPSSIAYAVVTDQDDNIYMNTQSTGVGHGMRKYDYSGGFLMENTNLPASLMSCDDIDSIYCYQSGSDIKRIDYDLNTIWTVSLSAPIQGLKAVSDGVIYSIYDGTTKKVGKLDKNGIEVFEVDTSSMGYFTNAQVDTDGNIYFEYANKITKLDRLGNLVWSAVSPTNMSNSFTVNETTGHIYWRSNYSTIVNAQQGYMRVISISDGTEVTSGIFTNWSNPDGSFYSSDDFIAIQNNDCEVVFIDNSTYANVYRVAGILE